MLEQGSTFQGCEQDAFRNMMTNDDSAIRSLSNLWTRITRYTFPSFRARFTRGTLEDKTNTQDVMSEEDVRRLSCKKTDMTHGRSKATFFSNAARFSLKGNSERQTDNQTDRQTDNQAER